MLLYLLLFCQAGKTISIEHITKRLGGKYDILLQASDYQIKKEKLEGHRVLNLSAIDTSQMALVELEIVNQFYDEVIRDRRVTLTGMIGTLGK